MTRLEAVRHILWASNLHRQPGRDSFRKLLKALALFGVSPIEWMELLYDFGMAHQNRSLIDKSLQPILDAERAKFYGD